jgi:hypothetical protein
MGFFEVYSKYLYIRIIIIKYKNTFIAFLLTVSWLNSQPFPSYLQKPWIITFRQSRFVADDVLAKCIVIIIIIIIIIK